MPWVFKRCKAPGCKERFTDLKESYCEAHRKELARQYNQTQRDPEIVAFYKSEAWQKARKAKLSIDPLCEVCLKAQRTVVATVVDHIHEVRHGGDRLDMANLQSLCASCHSKKPGWGKRE